MNIFDSETISRAATLWNYMTSFRSTGACDAVAVCCSYDLRVCDYACGLIKACFVACPDLQFPQDVSNVIDVFGIINEMVGDIERIQR